MVIPLVPDIAGLNRVPQYLGRERALERLMQVAPVQARTERSRIHNKTVQYAYERGVPVFSAVGYLTSPYAVNSSANFMVGGNMLGEWMAKEIGGKGNVLVVEGIPGTSASDFKTKVPRQPWQNIPT